MVEYDPHMTFAAPELLFLLPAALIPIILRWVTVFKRPVLTIPDATMIQEVVFEQVTWRTRLRELPTLLRTVAIALLIVGLARPQEGLVISQLPEEGVDIVLALDTSSSMKEATPDGISRLQTARNVIESFVSTLESDRVGLVIFRSRGLVLSPLTLDHDALIRAVRAVRTDLLPDGTAIGLGMSEALNLLRDSPARSQVVILLTDGQNNVGEIGPIEAAKIAEALSIRIYTVGFRSSTSLTAGLGGLDEIMLKRISDLTDATYFDASTEQELSTAYNEIGNLERTQVGERRFTSFRELSTWFVITALVVLSIDISLRSTLLRRYP